MRVVAIIGARLNSSRLPGKHLMPLAGQPMIQRLLQRLQQCCSLNDIVLATTADAYNKPLLDWARGRCSHFSYNGDVDDLVGRIDTTVKWYSADIVVYLCGDCPMIDPGFIDHGVHALMDSPQSHTVALHPQTTSIHEGIDFYTRQGWDALVLNSSTRAEREHVGYANKSKRFLVTLTIADSDDYSAVEHRISVDTPADYDFMVQVYDRWYQSHDETSIVSLKWLQNLLQKSPELVNINSHVLQKQPENKYRRVSLYCHASARIGLGHVKRCSLIAETLLEKFGMGVHIHVSGQRMETNCLPECVSWYESDESLFQQMAADCSHEWILDFHPDSINLDRLIEICRGKKIQDSSFVIALDKLAKLLPVVDHWFIPSFYSDSLSPKVIAGWNNYILPKSFHRQKVKQVLVMTGGSDALEYGSWLPEVLQHSTPPNWSIRWIQGPYADAPILPKEKARWKVHRDPDNLQQLIASSRVIISCYGLSLVEAMRSGAVTLLLPVKHLCGDDELAALRSYQCCFIAECRQHISPMLRNVFYDEKLASRYRVNASKLLAGADGATTIGNILQGGGKLNRFRNLSPPTVGHRVQSRPRIQP